MEKMRLILVSFLLCISFDGSACTVTLGQYGAVGNGLADDSIALMNAFNSFCPGSDSAEHKIIDGENKIYAVYGWLRMADNLKATLKNIKLVQKQVSAGEIRTLFKRGGELNLINVSVDRGTSLTTGEKESAGIWIEVENSTLQSVEVIGNGLGTGLMLAFSKNVMLDKIYVHNMRWATSTPPEYEALTGISILNSENVTLKSSRVESLFGNMGNGIFTRFQSDGITVGGTRGVKIISTVVEKTGEGIDFTGSAGNVEFEVTDTTVYDAHSFGFKFANTASKGTVTNSLSYRSGYAGFLVQGLHGGGSLPISVYETQNILLDNCKAINTGHDSEWRANNIAGFLIMTGYPTNVLPRNIQIKNSSATNDYEHRYLMNYGFFSETKGNTVFNVLSTGHKYEGSYGFLQGAP